ncbi:hypothetical protein [Paraburkholderia caledonica]|uniref:hypothetical protein n=1 Tax=Paraburkholderia caledonica TaxID=134536 RepID=UPI001177F5C2|nr:hypothetical protein [Paraburkholderia caledonica]
MIDFVPDQHQKSVIEQALQAHHMWPKRGQLSPDRPVKKWSSMVSLPQLLDIGNQISDALASVERQTISQQRFNAKRSTLSSCL